MTGSALDLHSRPSRVSDLAAADLDGETALLSVAQSAYFGMDPIASRVWSLLDGQRSVGEICALLVSEYDVEPARCQEDVLAYLTDLRREGLLREEA